MLSPNDPSFFEPVLSPNAPACRSAGLTPVSISNMTAPPGLDLKKAFDTVCHPILINKLQSFGVGGLELDWFTSYLSNRKQITKVGIATSDMASVNFGVPQGSILGPLLFTLYINSLPSIVSNCKVNLYADDTALFYAGKSVVDIGEKLTADMSKVAVWMEESRLTLNASKTKAMLFGSHFKLCKATP